MLRALASRGDPLPQEVVRSLERRSSEEEDQVIARNWTDPDLRDHPSVVDWRKAAVLGKLGKENRIDLTRNCELHELAKWHHLPVARSSAILLAHFLHVPYKDNLRRQTDNPNFLGHLWH